MLPKTVVRLCRCTTEVAGIGLDAALLRFARQHLQAIYAWPLGGSFVFSLGAHSHDFICLPAAGIAMKSMVGL